MVSREVAEAIRVRPGSHRNGAPFRAFHVLIACALALGLGACASTGSGASSSGDGSAQRGDVITSEQLDGVGRISVYDAVRRLRPAWLRNRGYDSFQRTVAVRVYLDGQSFGLVDDLRNMQTTNVATIRWLDGMAATQRFGMDHGAGVILVTRTDGPPR